MALDPTPITPKKDSKVSPGSVLIMDNQEPVIVCKALDGRSFIVSPHGPVEGSEYARSLPSVDKGWSLCLVGQDLRQAKPLHGGSHETKRLACVAASTLRKRMAPGTIVRSCGHPGIFLEFTDSEELVVAYTPDQASKMPLYGLKGCAELPCGQRLYVWRLSSISYDLCELPTVNTYRIAQRINHTPLDTNQWPGAFQ